MSEVSVGANWKFGDGARLSDVMRKFGRQSSGVCERVRFEASTCHLLTDRLIVSLGRT